MSKTVKITNLYTNPISLSGGDGAPRLKINVGGYKETLLSSFQFDALFVTNLATYVTGGKLKVELNGQTLTADQCGKLGHRYVATMEDDKDDDGIADLVYVKTPAIAIDLKAVAETNGALGGLATQQFIPRRAIIKTGTVVGALNGNVDITIGTTTPGGTEILNTATLTGVDATADIFVVLLTGLFHLIAGNATIYVNVTSADTGAGTGTATVTLEGQFV